MPKKRLIFTLLYDRGSFVLSRNFRLQRVGDIAWLLQNYNFSQISFFIDELVILDVSRGSCDVNAFCDVVKLIAAGCFAPIAAGGKVRDIEHARRLLRSGADKIVVNTALFDQPDLIQVLAESFGQQCVVGSVDMKREGNGLYRIYVDSGARALEEPPMQVMSWLGQCHVGELYLNSIDRDGTGQGYDKNLLDQLPADFPLPVILAGGVGNGLHLSEGMADQRVDAAATAHLFNFIGDGLRRARATLLEQGQLLAYWPPLENIVLHSFHNEEGE